MEGMNVNNDQRRHRRHRHRHRRSRSEMEEGVEVDNPKLEEFALIDLHHHDLDLEESQVEDQEGQEGPPSSQGPVDEPDEDGLPGSMEPGLEEEDVLEQLCSYYREKLTRLGKKNKSLNRKLEEAEAEIVKLRRGLKGAEVKLKLMRDILGQPHDQVNSTLDGAVSLATGQMSPPPGEADEAISTRTFGDEEEDLEDPSLEPSQLRKETGSESPNLNETFTSPGLLQTLELKTSTLPQPPASSPVDVNNGDQGPAASISAGIAEPDEQANPNNGGTQADNNSSNPSAPPGPKFRLIKLNLSSQQLAALIQADRQRHVRQQGSFRRVAGVSGGMRNEPVEMDRAGKRDSRDDPTNPTKRQRSSGYKSSQSSAAHPGSSHHHHVPGTDDGEEVRFLHSEDIVRESQEPGNFCTCSNVGYATKSTLLQHIKYFNAEWKFVCPCCKERFFSTGSLRVHLLRKHNKYLPVGVTGCSKCGQLFPSNREMAHHRRVIGCDASSG